jgi:hypothetical protein
VSKGRQQPRSPHPALALFLSFHEFTEWNNKSVKVVEVAAACSFRRGHTRHSHTERSKCAPLEGGFFHPFLLFFDGSNSLFDSLTERCNANVTIEHRS